MWKDLRKSEPTNLKLQIPGGGGASVYVSIFKTVVLFICKLMHNFLKNQSIKVTALTEQESEVLVPRLV